MLCIFEKQSFTLKELCLFFYKFDELKDILNCYLYFSSNNNNYRNFLLKTRTEKGLIYHSSSLNKNIYLREILQIFDPEFNKLVIRIHTEPNDYDITITWDEFEKKINGITKDEIQKIISLS